ncbi:MAG: DUF1080 domain-containing protein, partial [Chlorobia bacterium]|nr:DUF1080 domain-containing protein [Fimbriimonadaceae bacterium]
VTGTPNSFLCTDKVYGDFELEFEVWVDPTMNSGVQIRSNSVPGYREGGVHGYQVEIDPLPRAWSGGLYDENRRGWLQDLSKNPNGQKAFKNGQWNKFRVVAKGDRIQTWVNRARIVDFRDSMTQTGFIGLQVHNHDKAGVEVKWRNIKVKDLGIPTANPPKGGEWLLKTEADLKNWARQGKPEEPNPWTWVDSAMEVKPRSGSIMSKRKFSDFRMHMEFMVDDNGRSGQANGNSGVYLMGSYELQILNSAPRGPADNECGGIYTIKAPDYAMALPAGVWQSYDVTLKAAKWNGDKKTENARVTIYHNGTLIHNNIVLPNPTGAGDPESPNPRPFYLQDHGNRIRFRNIWVSEKV